MAKSFKGYGAMWSKPNEPEKESDKQAHNKENKQTPVKESVKPETIQAQEANKEASEILNKETPKKSNKKAHDKQDKEAPKKIAEEDNIKKTPNKYIKQVHDKNKKQTPEKTVVEPNLLQMQDNNKEASNNSFITENKETPIKKRGRGRPKMDTTEKKTHFNLLLRPATITALNTIAGRMQAETGKRVTVTGLITQLIDEFVVKQKESA